MLSLGLFLFRLALLILVVVGIFKVGEYAYTYCYSVVSDTAAEEEPGRDVSVSVTRPNEVTVRFMGEDGEWYELEGTELLARAICHECDHLDGKLYVDLVEGDLHDVTYTDDEEE